MTERSQAKVPMSRHPLFPVIVAGWFAALLGIGSFALRTSVLENAVLALRIDTLVPAAVPPLGFTARLLLSLALMLGGALLGYGLARLVARGGSADARPSRKAAAAAAGATGQGKSPAPEDPANEDDDLTRLAAARANLPQRRRALALDEVAEIPARGGPSILNVGDLDVLSPLGDTEPAAPAPAAVEAPAPAEAATAPQAPAPAAAADSAAARLRGAPLDSLGIPELVERFALALAARRARRAPAAAAPGQAAPPAPAPFLDDSRPAETAASVEQAADPRPFAMPPSLRQPGLGNVEWFDEAEEDARLESLLPPKRPQAADPFKLVATAEPAVEPEPEQALWRLPEPEEEADDNLGASGADGADAETPFSSLLDMKPSARPPAALGNFVRVEDAAPAGLAEPVVVFPGQAVPPPPVPARLPGAPFGASPVATEAALREALSALQKMSGTR